MHSFIGGFSEEEIARIRLESRKKRLSDSLYQYLLLGDDEDIKAKIVKFTDELEELKKMSVYMSASDMLREIYARYDYTVMVSSLPNGQQRLANVKMLIDTAEDYEQQGVVGIHDFVKFIDKMKKREVDMGEANTLDENANVVKIMTIHKSKGLEFPICFVSSLGTEFRANSDKILFDEEYGIGGEHAAYYAHDQRDGAHHHEVHPVKTQRQERVSEQEAHAHKGERHAHGQYGKQDHRCQANCSDIP